MILSINLIKLDKRLPILYLGITMYRVGSDILTTEGLCNIFDVIAVINPEYECPPKLTNSLKLLFFINLKIPKVAKSRYKK